jgi:hypothetical protein
MLFEEAMHEVLQTRRYDYLMGRTSNILDRAADFINRQMSALLERLSLTLPQGGNPSQVIPFIFALVGGILLAAGIIVLLHMLLRTRRRRVHPLSDLFGDLTDTPYTVSGLLALSENADTRRLSVRYRYIAALLAMDEERIIQITPSATNALILRALKNNHPALAKPFTRVADTFHLAWFGNKEIDDIRYTAFRSAGDTLMGDTRG